MDNSMSDSLTTLISKVQVLLGDDGTIFTTATVTAAIRQALDEWNLRVPVNAATLVTGVNDQYEYELTDFDANAVEILDLLRQGDNNNEQDISITYDDYSEDERLFFRLRTPVTTSDTLIVRYRLRHTINGLDSQTESTLPAYLDQSIVNGAAYFSIMIRATSRIETINLSQDQSDNYREIAVAYASAFSLRMTTEARKKRAPVGEPDTRAWNDGYHGWGQ
jgi:hypothetical protein